MLAQILTEVVEELEQLTQHFAPRRPGEPPERFAKRMVGSAVAVYVRHDSVMTTCNMARHNDIEIRNILEQRFEVVLRAIVGVIETEVKAGTAHPISADLPALIRALAGTIALMLAGDPLLVDHDGDAKHRVWLLEQLWLNALWGGVAKA